MRGRMVVKDWNGIKRGLLKFFADWTSQSVDKTTLFLGLVFGEIFILAPLCWSSVQRTVDFMKQGA